MNETNQENQRFLDSFLDRIPTKELKEEFHPKNKIHIFSTSLSPFYTGKTSKNHSLIVVSNTPNKINNYENLIPQKQISDEKHEVNPLPLTMNDSKEDETKAYNIKSEKNNNSNKLNIINTMNFQFKEENKLVLSTLNTINRKKPLIPNSEKEVNPDMKLFSLNIEAENKKNNSEKVYINENYTFESKIVKCFHGEIQKIQGIKDKNEYIMYTIRKLFIKNEKDFLNDLSIFKNINHQHLVPIKEYFQDVKNFYLIQNTVKGFNLHTFLSSLNSYNENTVGIIVHQILNALEVCHKSNLFSGEISLSDIYGINEGNIINIQINNFILKKHLIYPQIADKKKSKIYLIKPPEMKINMRNMKSDIWNVAIIMYILLSGQDPFNSTDKKTVKRKMTNNIVKFNFPIWKRISKEASTFILAMIQFDHTKRLSAIEALNHPWIKIFGINSEKNLKAPPLNILNDFKHIKKIENLRNKFPEIIPRKLFSRKDEQKIRQEFYEFDKNEDGLLSISEIIKGFSQLYGDNFEAEMEVEHYIDQIEFISYKSIKFDEFLSCYLSNPECSTEEFLIQRYKFFDHKNEGVITIEQFFEVCCGIQKDEKFNEALQKANNIKLDSIF